MSRVIRPFGTVAKEIVIQADTNGIMRVNAYSLETGIVNGFRPSAQKIPMDAREMVLALIKVVQDYSTVLFATMGQGVIKHGEQQENKNNDNSGQS